MATDGRPALPVTLHSTDPAPVAPDATRLTLVQGSDLAAEKFALIADRMAKSTQRAYSSQFR